MSCKELQLKTKQEVEMKNSLRIILAKQKKTVSDVHKATGLSKNTVTALYYERSDNPYLKTLLKIADYLDVSLDELLA